MKEEWGWVPLKAELPVYELEYGRVTAIDLIVYDTINRRITLVEVKTGYEGYFEKGEKQMKLGIRMSNSALNQAKIQLVTTAMMFLKMFPLVPSIKCWVVWLGVEKAVKRFPL